MGGDLTLRGVSVPGVPHGRLTSAPVCSPQLLASRSSSRSWPCATPWFLSGTGTASSTRPPPQVSPLGGTSPAVPFSVLWCRNLPHKAPAWASAHAGSRRVRGTRLRSVAPPLGGGEAFQGPGGGRVSTPRSSVLLACAEGQALERAKVWFMGRVPATQEPVITRDWSWPSRFFINRRSCFGERGSKAGLCLHGQDALLCHHRGRK